MPILKKFPQTGLYIAGESTDCGQKIHNLKFAIERLPEEWEVLAFVDSDCLLQRDWLRSLILRLLENPSDAVTGYRWFPTMWSDPASSFRAVWNSSVLTLFNENAKSNFAWGGSMAIYRSVFQEARVAEFWNGSISDDYGLTNALHASGRVVHFTPRALTMTAESITLRGFFSWASRQLLVTRLYYPRLWAAALAFHVGWVLWILTGLIQSPAIFLALFFLQQAGQISKAEVRLRCARRMYPSTAGHRFYYWVFSPFIGLANLMMLIKTVFSRRILWRGVEYLFSKNGLVLKPRKD